MEDWKGRAGVGRRAPLFPCAASASPAIAAPISPALELAAAGFGCSDRSLIITVMRLLKTNEKTCVCVESRGGGRLGPRGNAIRLGT